MALERKFVLATSMAFALTQLDNSVVNVSLVALGQEFSSPLSKTQWIITAYALAFSTLLLLAGTISDRFGHEQTFRAGMIAFAAASMGCALSYSANTLIFFRTVQGVSAAFLIPSALALINRYGADSPEARTKAIGWWMAAGGVALTVGPLIGAAFSQAGLWRGVFLINIPLALFAVITIREYGNDAVDEKKDRSEAHDYWNHAIAIAGLLGWAITFILLTAREYRLALACGLGSIVVTLFLVHIERKSPKPVFLRIRDWSFRCRRILLLGLSINACIYSLLLGVSLFGQIGLGLSPIETGLLLVPYAVFVSISNVVGGRVAAKFGGPFSIALGLGIACVGYAFLCGTLPSAPYVSLLFGSIVVSLGIGVVVTAMTASYMADLPSQDSGSGAAMLNAARQLGSAVGVAIVSMLWTNGGATGIQIMTGISAVLCAIFCFLFARELPPAEKTAGWVE